MSDSIKMQESLRTYFNEISKTTIETSYTPIMDALHSQLQICQSMYNMLDDEEKGIWDEILDDI